MAAGYLALALLSAASLAFEITLSRLFSVTQWYHFAFLAVSVALLGFGASGTALSLVPRWARPPTGRRAAVLSVLFSMTVLGAYLSLNHLPFDSYRIAWEPIQALYLVLYYLALAVPFFCAGLVTGLLLAAHPERASRLYAANLGGSAVGGLLPVLILPVTGEGVVLVVASLGLLSAALFLLSECPSRQARPARASKAGPRHLPTPRLGALCSQPVARSIRAGPAASGPRCRPIAPAAGALSSAPGGSPHPGGGWNWRFHCTRAAPLLLGAGLLLGAFALAVASIRPLPGLLHLRLSPYKGLSQALRFPQAEVVWQRWNAFSRVDRVASPAIRSAPGLSLTFTGELPAEDGLFVDGDDLSPRLTGPGIPDSASFRQFTSNLPAALPYRLRPGAKALVLGPRGGLDLALALSQGAASVVAVEANRLLVEAGSDLYRDPRVMVRLEEGRAFARHSHDTFDVVHLSLTDGYRPVTSGAFGLGERYDLTVEAFQDYLARLRPGGLLVLERWLQLPPSEELRAAAAAVEALRRAGVAEPVRRLVVLRDWQLALILVKNGDLTGDEAAAIRRFSEERGLDLVALPGLSEEDANRFNLLAEPVYFRAFRRLLDDPAGLYAESIYDVRPASDDRPFFHHFFRWRQTRAVLDQMGRTWQPWGGSGYLVLLALLTVAALTSAVLILLPPLLGRRAVGQHGRVRVLCYFGLLGLGFLFVEIPLMQRFILFLGRPIYAFTAVAGALLFFASLGSLLAGRITPRRSLPALALVVASLPFCLPLLFRTLLGASLGVRLVATALSLAPLGLLLGMPFPGGLAWLRDRSPGLVPWAWAVNGCASVLSSIGAALIALSAGFSWVLVAAAVCYALAWLAICPSHP